MANSAALTTMVPGMSSLGRSATAGLAGSSTAPDSALKIPKAFARSER